MTKNLRGARARLATALALGVPSIATLRDDTPLDVAALIAEIDARLASLHAADAADDAPALRGVS
jgi:hypothetical protein